jgi:dienelactone hydrolase
MNMVFTWLKGRIAKTSQHDTIFWRVMATGQWLVAGAAVVIAGRGNPTGFGLIFDLLLYSLLHVIVFFLLTKIAATLLSLMYLPIPRLFISSLLYTGCLVYLILNNASLGTLFSFIIAVVYTIAGVLVGLIFNLLLNERITFKRKVIFVMLPMACYLFFLLWSPIVNVIQPDLPKDVVRIPTQGNPAEPGSYTYRYFTYGSGEDKHRKEYNSDAELLSTSVDASDYIDEWPWKREYFWGFDEKNLPLNGRVWMPEGKGPFPLVLIIHGNHRMEHFSDDGYGYLGELLASRGFIAISIDQNFLNHSNWSGIPKQDTKLRAWVLMHHLLQIEKFQDMPNTPFYQQVNFQKIALIGHSRGGPAATMTADYTKWFAEDTTLSGIEKMGIQAVVGLAPTDKRVDGKNAALVDTYYLVLHGAQDADVNSFLGDRQYARSSYNNDSESFKTSLYIGEANHSQFNTDWGRMDSSLPRGLFFNQRDTIDTSLQREIAKVYIAAFLETALHGNDQYIQLFRDYRYGESWLPKAQYFSRFENGIFIQLTEFNRNKDKAMFESGITVTAEGFTKWEIEEAKDRRGNRKGIDGVVLAWNNASTYTITVSDSFRNDMLTNRPERLVISMANMERDLTNSGVESISLPQIDVELETESKVSVRIPLDQFMPFPPQVYTQYTRVAWFDNIMRDGKYSEAAEPVFQTYELPLYAFKQSNPEFQSEQITKITLYFSGGPGKVFIDNIGFYTE